MANAAKTAVSSFCQLGMFLQEANNVAERAHWIATAMQSQVEDRVRASAIQAIANTAHTMEEIVHKLQKKSVVAPSSAATSEQHSRAFVEDLKAEFQLNSGRSGATRKGRVGGIVQMYRF